MLSDGLNMVAWIDFDVNHRLEISYTPDNHPVLNVSTVLFSDQELAKHINSKLQGWTIHKCNIDGVNKDDYFIAEKKERGEENA